MGVRCSGCEEGAVEEGRRSPDRRDDAASFIVLKSISKTGS